MKPSQQISLLWPGINSKYYTIPHKDIIDLDMSNVFEHYEELMEQELMDNLVKIPIEEETVIYRQEILRDFIDCKGLMESFTEVANKFIEMNNMIKFAFEREYTLYNVLKRLEESEEIFNELHQLRNSLWEHSIKSEGLKRYKKMLDELYENELFTAYINDLKHIQKLQKVSGIKIGLNLDKDLAPNAAIVLSIEEEPFKYSRTMKKMGRILGYGLKELKMLPRRIFAPETTIPKENLNELEKIIEPAMQQLIKFSDNFNTSLMDTFGSLWRELTLYEFGFQVKRKLEREGLLTSQVSFHNGIPPFIKGLYNINLTYKLIEEHKLDTLVTNDLNFDANGNIFILTGANRGGKTTFTQAIGQIYWLGLQGLFVPASAVNLRMIDGLYVHFPSEEEETVLFGRLGEECQRFATIYEQMTDQSLLLMNESFSGTSHLESLTIAKESLSAIQLLGANCIFNTHLHELALTIDELNDHVIQKEMAKAKGYSQEKMQNFLAKENEIRFKNLISGSDKNHQSFKIVEGEPLGKSYAYEIARSYGVTYEQLIGGR